MTEPHNSRLRSVQLSNGDCSIRGMPADNVAPPDAASRTASVPWVRNAHRQARRRVQNQLCSLAEDGLRSWVPHCPKIVTEDSGTPALSTSLWINFVSAKAGLPPSPPYFICSRFQTSYSVPNPPRQQAERAFLAAGTRAHHVPCRSAVDARSSALDRQASPAIAPANRLFAGWQTTP